MLDKLFIYALSVKHTIIGMPWN